MPLQIDPEWEYWTPDPEIEELFQDSGRLGTRVFGMMDFPRKKDFVAGIRFGKGNPDGFWGHLALPKWTSRDFREEIPERKCKGCQKWFTPNRSSRVYCSLKCTHRFRGRPRELEDVECGHCNRVFRPRDSTQKFCSVRCWSVEASKKAADIRTKKFDENKFRLMWLGGVRVIDIQKAFDSSKKWVQTTRKKMGLPKRKER